MPRFKITRTWKIDAEDITEALTKTKNWKHFETNVERLPISEDVVIEALRGLTKEECIRKYSKKTDSQKE